VKKSIRPISFAVLPGFEPIASSQFPVSSFQWSNEDVSGFEFPVSSGRETLTADLDGSERIRTIVDF
jgi:hypothetical protein